MNEKLRVETVTEIPEELDLLLDCWMQFSSYQDPKTSEWKHSTMGLSTLERLKRYLREKDLINDNGSAKF